MTVKQKIPTFGSKTCCVLKSILLQPYAQVILNLADINQNGKNSSSRSEKIKTIIVNLNFFLLCTLARQQQ